MAKFCGRVGFGETVEVAPGVHTDTIVEHILYGDLLVNKRALQQGETLNQSVSVGNSISVVASAYAREHFFAMKYVEWAGKLWTVKDVEVQAPRLILQLGEVYNGPTAGAPDTP